MPDKIQWLPEYSVNNEIIDQQHQYLFDLCKTLYLLVDQAENSQSVEQALAGLLDYVELHFREEEQYYKTHPKLAEHQELHRQFIKQTNEYVSRFKEGNLKLSELADFVYAWIVQHITVSDRNYFRDINKTPAP